MRDGAITYVQDNAEGVINLLKRNNEAVVYGTKGKIVYNYDSATDGTTFARKADDKFTYVVFGANNPEITLATTAMKVDDVNALAIKDLSMKFTDETNLKTNSLSFESLEVAAGAHLQVLSGNTVYVNDLANSGVITVGGTIYYHKTKTGNGKVYSVGNGAIVYAPTMITTGDGTTAEDNLIAAIAAGEYIVLGEDVNLTNSLSIPAGYEGTINLNGKTLSGQVISNGALTIKNGTISYSDNVAVKSKGALTMENVNVSASKVAVHIPDGTAEISGGSIKGNTCEAGYYALLVQNAESVTISNVDFSENASGGISIYNSTANLEGTEGETMNLKSGSGSVYGLTIVNAVVTYNDFVNFDTCYLQTKSESSSTEFVSTVNNATINHGSGNIDSGYVWTSNAKTSLNTLIASIL